MAVFKPTGTSKALIEAVKPHIKGGKLLDLACGCGIVGDSLSGSVDKVFASDISEEAVSFVKKTYPSIDARRGDLFEPWGGELFDYIVDDVSGVSEEVAKLSPWFDGVPCDSGVDGVKLVIKMLLEARDHLHDSGKVFFPALSFSDTGKILELAERFYEVAHLSHTEFPLPKEMYRHIDLLKKLKVGGYISFRERFGMVIWSTDIYAGVKK